MSRPDLGSRIEQDNDPLRSWIDARQIRSLVAIATGAGEGQILDGVAPAVLSGKHMLDLKSNDRS
jgi:hypothetical protein